jgi:membrane fusion protein, heavy metal efflux system
MSAQRIAIAQRAGGKSLGVCRMSQSLIKNHNLKVTPHDAPAASPAAEPLQSGGVWSTLKKTLPTLTVVGALAGIAYWGHSSDWTLPTFSALLGQEEAAAPDWCEAHNVPESQCIECNKGLVDAGKEYGWCPVHGIAQCPLEHPDVAQLKATPAIATEDLDRAKKALALRPRVTNNSHCKLHKRHIQFASVEAMEKAGVDIAVVGQRPVIEAAGANGEVIYDETHSAHLASRVGGTVWRVEKQVGQRVAKGDILALIDAAEVGRAKSDFLQAIAQLRMADATVERLKPLAGGAVAGKQVREADAARQEAQIRLMAAQQALVNLGLPVRAERLADLSTDQIAEQIQFLGLPPEMVASFDADSTTSNLFPLRSPLDGVVTSCSVVPGEVVDKTNTIYGVADVRRMWLMLNVRQDDANYLSLGQTVLFRASDSENVPEIRGTLDWISTEADDQTRTVKVRANLPNEDGKLRANTFGVGRIVLREEPKAIVVPSEAVHSDGCCSVVFVRDKNFNKEDAPKFFHIRKVRLGVKDGGVTEIIAGVLPGEVIASKNSVVLEAQLLKSNLGAGCGCGKD